jgi:hypothetical protein
MRAAKDDRGRSKVQKMLISVIRAGKGIFHFTGDLDSYNLELLRDLAMRGEELEGAEMRIRVDPAEEAALQERKQWLENLTRAGVSVHVEHAPGKLLRESWYEALKSRSARPQADTSALRAVAKEIA